MIEENSPDFSAPAMVEGIAHVVAVEGTMAWLEPEQTTSCGSCASSSACGAKGIGTTASRLEARRFSLENQAGLAVGERVVVGIRENALVKASLTAYAIPLATALIAGTLAQWAEGRDGITMAAMAGGLLLGLGLARLGASRLSTRGELAPRFLRRADAAIVCHPVTLIKPEAGK
ncbi:SoxR reducing system RseC family protein [Sulfuricella sp.]|uniref:SoxR reducing system RseC family protein n=1 Tax=Sulfuricella sp. TaxID=2099377 RepID=UPI002B5ECB24|nr:SoxR reducing system RseC family protein [Sulfuricella sp.]HUX63853.1 SoxR reducing system RseC family protein [Sulfuricella sp.]